MQCLNRSGFLAFTALAASMMLAGCATKPTTEPLASMVSVCRAMDPKECLPPDAPPIGVTPMTLPVAHAAMWLITIDDTTGIWTHAQVLAEASSPEECVDQIPRVAATADIQISDKDIPVFLCPLFHIEDAPAASAEKVPPARRVPPDQVHAVMLGVLIDRKTLVWREPLVVGGFADYETCDEQKAAAAAILQKDAQGDEVAVTACPRLPIKIEQGPRKLPTRFNAL